MMKFMVLLKGEGEKFENAYNDFLALVERMPHIIRRQVVHVVASPNSFPLYQRVLEIYFADRDMLEAGLLSAAGQEAGSELNRRFLKDSFDILIAEVFEEEGGATPPTEA